MKTFIKITAFIFLSAQLCFSQGLWRKIGDMPERRYAHTADEINGKIYIVGGAYDEGTALPKTAMIYDETSGKWTLIPLNNNMVRAAHNSCVVNGKLYVMGGNDGIKTIATMEMYDPATGLWESKKTMPTDRGLAAGVSIGDKIYVIGGIRGPLNGLSMKGLNILEVYDTKSDTWTRLADMLTYRWGLSATAADGKIYVFGGRSEGQPYSTVEMYDPALNTWTTRTSRLPTPRYCHTSCLMDSSIYVIAGWQHSSMGPIYNNVEIYDYKNDKWKIENPLPVYRAVLASTEVDGKIYVFGGARSTHPNYGTSEIHEFSNKDIFAYKPFTDKTFARPNIDSVIFRTEFFNYYGHQFTSRLIITCSDSSKTDSIDLYDDGLHGDLLSGDGIYGNYITPRTFEDFFLLSAATLDNISNKYFRTLNLRRFTTAGPVVLDSIALQKAGNLKFNAQPYLKNTGQILTINNASVAVMCNDPWVSLFGAGQLKLPPLSPGVTTGTTNMTPISYIDSLFISKGYFNIKVTILTAGFPYWKDSTRAFAAVTTSDLKKRPLPMNFSLGQNYPNPFNPATTISYSLASPSYVTLKIFDILGREVATLINEEKPEGLHNAVWKADNISSGVYFYELRAGNFIEKRKMMLIR